MTRRRAAMSALVCGLMTCLSAVGAADPGAPPASAPKREYYLLLDTSTSMRGERIQRLKEGLVREFLPSLDGETRLHLFTFDEGIQITNRVFTLHTPDDIRRVTEFINGLKADGRSTWAWSSLRQVLETGRREYGTGGETLRFFMYTDGEDNQNNGPRLEDVLATYDLVRTISDDRAGLKIFTLGFALHADALAACKRHGVPVLDVPDAEPIPMPSIVDFTWWPPRPPAGTSVKFLNQSIPKTGRVGSRWAFDDGSQVDGVPEPERIFPKAGTYKVSLAVGADKETKSIVIVAPDEKLTAEFVCIPDNPVAGSVVHFISRSAGPIKKYKWELGRNRVADGERASLLFPDEGEYTNRLTVYGELTEDSTSVKLTVRPAPVPELKVRLYPESAQVGQPINFWVDDIPGLSNVVWTSAATASPASANRVRFSFPSPGTNMVSATAMWQGRQLVSSAVVNITPLSRPECRHLVRGSEPFVVGRTIFLQDASQGHVTNWYWDFGDGTRSSIPHPEKTYAATGNYSVLHVVMGPGGRDEESIPLRIVNPPAPKAAFSVRTPTNRWVVGETLVFQDRSSGAIGEWTWDFGDQGTSTNRDPEHIYADAGDFPVTLSVAGLGGQSSTGMVLRVRAGVRVQFDVSPRVGEIPLGGRPLTVRLRNFSEGLDLKYTWNFSDGSPVVHDFEPTHGYATAGVYAITLSGRHQDTGEERDASPVTVEIRPNTQVRRACRASAIIFVVLAAGWMIWWSRLRQPPLRERYDLGGGRLGGRSALTLGSGWRHDIPLPPGDGLTSDFGVLEKVESVPDIQISSGNGGQLVLESPEHVFTNADLPRRVAGPATRPSGAAVAHSLSVNPGETVLVNEMPYQAYDSPGGRGLAPGWWLRAGPKGVGRLKLIRENETHEFETQASRIAIRANDKLVLGEFHMNVSPGKEPGTLALVPATTTSRGLVTALATLSFVAVAAPWGRVLLEVLS